MKKMEDFLTHSILLVLKYYKENGNYNIKYNDILVTYAAHVLGNKKTLLSVIQTSDLFEVTFDSEKEKFYFNVYNKMKNKSIDYKEVIDNGIESILRDEY